MKLAVPIFLFISFLIVIISGAPQFKDQASDPQFNDGNDNVDDRIQGSKFICMMAFCPKRIPHGISEILKQKSDYDEHENEGNNQGYEGNDDGHDEAFQ
jgi:hypothetical protein